MYNFFAIFFFVYEGHSQYEGYGSMITAGEVSYLPQI